MAGETISQRPARVIIGNVSTAESISAQYNPAQLREEFGVNYNDLEIQGLSHKPQQYKNTENHSFPNLDLGFDAMSHDKGLDGIDDARRFILSLGYSSRGATGVSAAGPPLVLFVWPKFISLRCRVRRISFDHQRFALSGQPVSFMASLQLQEFRLQRLYSEDVRQKGTRR